MPPPPAPGSIAVPPLGHAQQPPLAPLPPIHPRSRCLLEVARAAEGFSGRTLRKLPFLAHAAQDFPAGRCSCLQYVNALLAAVQRERADRASLSDGT